MPTSYLRVVFMNAAGTAVTATHTIDMSAAAQGSELTAYEELQLLNLAAPADGFVAIYVANESPTDVYFDNLEVELEQYQENQSCATLAGRPRYYAFRPGRPRLNMAGIEREGQPENKFQYNGGTEKENALGLGMYETPFRGYDAHLGRFHQVEPLADIFNGISTYQFAFNNPVSFNDPLGLQPFGTRNASRNGYDYMKWDEFTCGKPDVESWFMTPGEQHKEMYWGSKPQPTGAMQMAMALFNNTNGNASYSATDTENDDEAFRFENGRSVHIFYRSYFENQRKESYGLPHFAKNANTPLGFGGLVYGALENAIHNKYWWMDSKGNFKSTALLEKGSNGKYVRGVQGYRNGYASAAKAARPYKLAGGIGFTVTTAISFGLALNYYDQGGTDWRVAAKTGMDIGFSAAAFVGPKGLAVSTAYFSIDYATNGFGGFGDPLNY